jgi:hypothetical protein
MRKFAPALAVVFAATIGAGSAAQAARIDFTFGNLGGTITASPEPLQDATQLNLDGAKLQVTDTLAGDESGLSVGDFFSITQVGSSPATDIIFGSSTGPLAEDVIKKWSVTTAPTSPGEPPLGDVFTETLTTVSVITPSANAITIDLTGTVSDTDGLFDDKKVSLIIAATQSGGPGNAIGITGSNSTFSVPEPSTWVMLALGFMGLGYAAVRRSAKDRSALAI